MQIEIKTVADLEALVPRERDAWFAERLNIEPSKYYWALSKDGGKSVVFTAETAKEAHDYLEQQLKSYYDYFADYEVVKSSILPEITTTTDGIASIKAEMVKLGYSYQINGSDEGHFATFYNQHFSVYDIVCDNEIDATWKAAALALLGE